MDTTLHFLRLHFIHLVANPINKIQESLCHEKNQKSLITALSN